MKRYNNEGILGLKAKPPSRPADVLVEKFLEGGKELSENPLGWKVKQIERTGVRHHEVHVYTSRGIYCYTSEANGSITIINTASKEGKKCSKEETHIRKDFIVAEDESNGHHLMLFGGGIN